MAAGKRLEFKVVFDGIELDERARTRLASAVQEAVLKAIIDIPWAGGGPIVRFPRPWPGIILGPVLDEAQIERLGGQPSS